jgi:hypothetical protein
MSEVPIVRQRREETKLKTKSPNPFRAALQKRSVGVNEWWLLFVSRAKPKLRRSQAFL